MLLSDSHLQQRTVAEQGETALACLGVIFRDPWKGCLSLKEWRRRRKPRNYHLAHQLTWDDVVRIAGIRLVSPGGALRTNNYHLLSPEECVSSHSLNFKKGIMELGKPRDGPVKWSRDWTIGQMGTIGIISPEQQRLRRDGSDSETKEG